MADPDPRAELERLADEHARTSLPDFTPAALAGDLPLHDVTVIGAVGAYLSGGGSLPVEQQRWARDAAHDLGALLERLDDPDEFVHAQRLYRMALLMCGHDVERGAGS